MTCEIYPPMPTRKQYAALVLELDFGVHLEDLTAPLVMIRNRAQPVSQAVVGTGELSQARDEDDQPTGPILYTWDHLGLPGDPDEPGVYVIEIDADEGTWPTDQHFFMCIIEHVG